MLVSLTTLITAMQFHLEVDVTLEQERYLTLKIEELSSVPYQKVPIQVWMSHVDEYWDLLGDQEDDYMYISGLLDIMGFTEKGINEILYRYYHPAQKLRVDKCY